MDRFGLNLPGNSARPSSRIKKGHLRRNYSKNSNLNQTPTKTTAQAIVYNAFLIQSAAFFLFNVVVMSADVTAGFIHNTNHHHHYYDSGGGLVLNNGNSSGNPFVRHYQHLPDKTNLFLRSRTSSFLRTSNDDVSVYREFSACSNDLLTLSCPVQDSTVFLLSLYPLPNNDDAVKNPAACIAPAQSSSSPLSGSTNPPIDLSCQYFKNNVQSIRSRCKTTSSCSVRVADLFDYTSPVHRPCTVIATYQCHPSPKMKNLPQYLRFCTNDVMRLTCPEKQDWLVITTAVYDFRPPGGDKTCSNVKRNVYCYAPQTQQVIRNHCERKRSCKLLINETTFGPIFGRTSLAAAQPSNQRPMVDNVDSDATAQCPSADNFALYVYFMCVPRTILSPHPRSSLLNTGGSSVIPSSNKQIGSVNAKANPWSSTEEEGASSSEQKAEPTFNLKINGSSKSSSAAAPISPSKSKASISTPLAGVNTAVSGTGGSSGIGRSTTSTTFRTSPKLALPTSSPQPSDSQVVTSSVIEQPSSVFRFFSDWLFALDYIQRNPYPVVATASLGVCIGLLLGAAILLIRLSCRLRAARYHPPRRSVGLQCEMFAGRPSVLVRSTASQTTTNPSTRPSSGVQDPPNPPPQAPPQQPLNQQQRILATQTTTAITSNGQAGSLGQQQQQSMQAMAAMCAQTTITAPSQSILNPALYAGPSAATSMAANRPLLVPSSHQNYSSQMQQPLLPATMSTSVGSSTGSQAGMGALPNGSRNYTYTPRLSVRWFQ